MRKATTLLAVVGLIVALMAGTAAAKQNGKGNSGKGPAVVTYNFKGTLEEVDGDGPELDGDGTYVLVEVTSGNRAGRDAAKAYEQAHPGEPMSFVVGAGMDVEVLMDRPGQVTHILRESPRRLQKEWSTDTGGAR